MAKLYRGLDDIVEIPGYISAFAQHKNHQTVARSRQEKKGFSSQSKRFPAQFRLNENPGPGTYSCISSAEISSPSFSKHGTTGFASVTARAPRHARKRGIPAPNAYNLQGSLANKCDFNIGVSRAFRLPVTVMVDGPKYTTPAPNQYDVGGSEMKPSTVGTSTFLSKTGRNSLCQRINIPSPCHYEIKYDIIHTGPKVAVSPFRSNTARIQAPLQNKFPGPAAYSPHETPIPTRRTVLPRGHYLAISAPAVMVPKDPPSPGPGQYDIQRRYGSVCRTRSTAAFASRTERTLQDMQDNLGPGPGFYDPRMLSKQSFLYSNDKIWVPI